MLTLLAILAILIGALATVYFGYRLFEKVYSKAMESARVEVGRELKLCAAYFSHSPDVVRALETAAEMVLCGCEISGSDVKRELEGK